ncbi:MAG: hypothetical protein HFJ80_03585 [Clostridiales bacterium]|nr:hypothetical protein [Clostridiales bacterium]
MKDIRRQIEEISGKEDFLAFLHELAMDFRKYPDEWENRTVDLYLEAMLSWIEDVSSSEWNETDWGHIPYSDMAKILYMGKIYE